MATTTAPARTATGSGPVRSWVTSPWAQAGVVLSVLLLGYAAAHLPAGVPQWLDVGLGDFWNRIYDWIVNNRNSSPLFLYGFNYVSVGLGSAVVLINQALTLLTWPGVIVLGTLTAWRAAGKRVALFVLASFAVVGFTGLWSETLTTLSLIITSVLLALVIGIPLGIIAGRSDRFHAAIRPVLDFMQIMPAFAYLMPMLLLFGIGNPAAAVATTVYAAPPAVRITALAIRGVDQGVVEATTSLGSTPRQLLTKVQLPLAKRTILLGVNQTIMLAMSMVVIASVIGAGGLGDAIYQALNKVNVGEAFSAGIAIVLMAIALDRVTNAGGDENRGPDIPESLRKPVLGLGVLVTAAAAVLGRLAGQLQWPASWEFSIAGPVNAVNDGLQNLIGEFTEKLASLMLTWLLDPLTALLTGSPWWLLVLVAAAIGWVVDGWRMSLTGGLTILACGLLGAWEASMDTLAQVLIAGVVTVIIGFLVGILASRSDRLAAGLRPLLDAMQTLPPFVYLIPAVALFGVGRIPALAAAVIYALPPVIRLVNDGIRGCSPAAMEAAASQGSSRWQMLTKVQLPLAKSSLLLAVNQGIMMILAMVVIGALVGAGALGYNVVFGMAQNLLGLGLNAGLAIVCLGLFLDRLTQSAAK
ncbi:glycine betaine/proline transport system permease protein [Haloactinospora alba]|uniref:Glycine betaine/proline transport system permease protein n=1 Tax=Haloactinospora alba TaxID=405555 RepID=A0A543NAF7_9ACTN|nr:ABC transporter permease subunit [Haloactinospora alba]TQN28788.1 glycine betaine/proline transport system permease protein [Haloactinospora alba]